MADTVVRMVIGRIAQILGTEITRQATVHFAEYVKELRLLQGSMSRIMRELRVIENFLCQMDFRYHDNHLSEAWLQEVQRVLHDIDDIIDEYLYLVHQEHNASWKFFLKKLITRPRALYMVARNAKETEANLLHLSQIKDRWVPTLSNGDNANPSSILQRSQDLAYLSRSLPKEDIVGFEANEQKLVQWLGEEKTDLSVLVVHGMGGVGKTTLVSVVYKKELINFDCYSWMTISQSYTKKDILSRVSTELIKHKYNEPSETSSSDAIEFHENLKNVLKHKKYLVVLDDVWDLQVCADFFGLLGPNCNGSKVIITTRISDVAYLASQDRVLKIEPLSYERSWELFCKNAFVDYKCPTQLMPLSRQILAKCQGLPLAIVSVGRIMLMHDKSMEEWNQIHNRFSWELINNPMMCHVRDILHLSFISLPKRLRYCLLYCSILPQGCIFKRKKLVRLFVAEGFVQKRGESSMEEVAEDFLKELVRRNLLEVSERSESGRMKSVRMHAIVRELAIDLCWRNRFGFVHKGDMDGDYPENSGHRCVVVKLQTFTQQSFPGLNRVRSFIMMDRSMIPAAVLLPVISQYCKYMTVLELSYLPTEKIPNAIGYLFNLRYLGLRYSKVKILPKSIGRLHNLLTLDLLQSNVKKLPHGVAKLKKLRHLFGGISHDERCFHFCAALHVPKGLQNLTSLQTLRSLLAEDHSVIYLGQLRQLRSLQILNVKITYWGYIVRSLQQMPFLTKLLISAIDEFEILKFDELNPVPNIRSLTFRGRLAEGTLRRSSLLQACGETLNTLGLFWCQLRQSPLPSISHLSNLTSMKLTKAYRGERLIFLSGWFPKLVTLDIIELVNLQRIKIQLGALVGLKYLELSNLERLEFPWDILSLKSLESAMFAEISVDFLEDVHQFRIATNCRVTYSLR